MKSKIENYLTIEQARELFEIKGSDVVWRVGKGNQVKAGSIAGSIFQGPTTQYRHIGITCADKKLRMFYAHVIAYGLHTGSWAAEHVDHRNTNGLDNSKDNLRSATKQQNCTNQKARPNPTGVKGVRLCTDGRAKPYRASLTNKGRYVFCKYFATLEEATVAIRAARTLHHGEFANHG